MTDTQLWSTHAIIYRVHVRGFCDSNADGQGDIPGLISRLQHIQELGANTILLEPIFQRSAEEPGQGIVDFYKLQYEFGSMKDFELLVHAVHSRRMRIILTLEMNHTSDQHPWFMSSRSDRQSPFRNFYVWSDSDKKYPRVRHLSSNQSRTNWHEDEKTGQYYWSRFSAVLPELNYDHPDVRTEMVRVMRFWLNKGIDGLKLEGLPFLFERDHTNCENLPEIHQYLKAVRAYFDQNFPERLLLGEMLQPLKAVESYFGEANELHLLAHPSLPAQLLLVMIDQDASVIRRLLDQMSVLPDGCRWVTPLTSPEGLDFDLLSAEDRKVLLPVYFPGETMPSSLRIHRRFAPLLNNDQRVIRLINALLFGLPGIPALFYGDEIGMGDGAGSSGEVGLITPMQWDETRSAGFSQALPEKFFMPVIDQPPYDQKTVNVIEQESNPESLLNFMRDLIQIRIEHPELAQGTLQWLDTDNPSVAAFIRRMDDKSLFAVYNLSDRTCGARIPREVRQEHRMDLLGGYLRLQPDLTNLTLKPYQFGWFAL